MVGKAVALFEHDEGMRVQTRTVGKTRRRPVLRRSAAMEALVVEAGSVLTEDWKSGALLYDGLVYVMFLKDEAGVPVPLYIGKAETFGKGESNLSANITNLDREQTKFVRWGDAYYYHVGDLSAVSLPGHPPGKQSRKYRRWAEALFRRVPSKNPVLRTEVYFWCMCWPKSEIGIWEELGPTRLAFQEYLMIGVASAAFPGIVLNQEGQNRGEG